MLSPHVTSQQKSSKDETPKKVQSDLPDACPKESQSLLFAESIIEQVMSNLNHEITWIELSKHKVPFATTNMRYLLNRVSELHFMKPDPRRVEMAEREDEDEPAAAKADSEAPNMIKTKFRPPPVPEISLGNSTLDKLKKKLTPGMRGIMNLSRTSKSPGGRPSIKM